MAMNWNTFFQRLGSAIIFSAIMMLGLLWNDAAFTVLVIIINVLCLLEFIRIGRKNLLHRVGGISMADILLVISSIVIIMAFHFQWQINDRPILYSVVAILSLILMLAHLMNGGTMGHVGISASGMVYILLPMLCFMGLRAISPVLPLALILMIWMNDTMAYLVGSFIGRTPFNSISPKKTWEGTIGGILLTIAGAAIWGYYSPYYTMIDWIALALCASIAGTAGDLFESKLKREAKLKDSGRLMPGHGGALDRFDSLLFTAPFAFAYAWLFMPHVMVKFF